MAARDGPFISKSKGETTHGTNDSHKERSASGQKHPNKDHSQSKIPASSSLQSNPLLSMCRRKEEGHGVAWFKNSIIIIKSDK